MNLVHNVVSRRSTMPMDRRLYAIGDFCGVYRASLCRCHWLRLPSCDPNLPCVDKYITLMTGWMSRLPVSRW